jgi:SAM-dependent methyltransferase
MDPQSIAWVNLIRTREIEILFERLPRLHGDLLEIGGGSGQQALLLARRGLHVVSLDVPSSGYREERVFEMLDYDGVHIPFPDASFDVVFSSNALEHVIQLDRLEAEMLRVLRPNGRAIHIVPSHRWRLWTWLTHYPSVLALIWRRARRASPREALPSEQERRATPNWVSLVQKALIPSRHGEHGTAVGEYAHFHPHRWAAHFEDAGWRIVDSFDLGIFYTGSLLARWHLPIALRERFGHLIGGATQCFVLEKRQAFGGATRPERSSHPHP